MRVATLAADDDFEGWRDAARSLIAERVPASVTGDGTSTIEQLVDTANADPRRGVGHPALPHRLRDR